MIKVMNDKGDDLSLDMMLNVGVMLAFIQGAERICNVLNRKVEAQGYTVRLLRENKQAFNEAVRVARRLQYILDNHFTSAFDKVEGGDASKCDSMGELSIIMVKMGLAYLSKIDRDNKNIDRCLNRVMSYKGVDGIHIDEILKMYDIR